MIMTKISVIVPTYNRATVLKDTLECLIKQKTNGEFDYEIIVVDNNSKDNTREVVDSYIAQFQGSFMYVFEPKQARAHALNAGLKAAKGDIICCVDDDCLVEETYLGNINRVFQEYGPDVGVVGGKIFPKWLGNDYPFWLDAIFNQPARLENGAFNWTKISFEGVLGILDFGNEPFILDYTQKDCPRLQFYGANMAFRRSILERYGDFSAENPFGEDTEICKRLFNAGIKGIYAPSVGLYHKIPTDKGTPAFFYKWWFGRGIHMEIKEKYEPKFYYPFGIPMVLILKTIGLFQKSFQEKDLFSKIRFRWQGFFNLGQMTKLFKQNII